MAATKADRRSMLLRSLDLIQSPEPLRDDHSPSGTGSLSWRRRLSPGELRALYDTKICARCAAIRLDEKFSASADAHFYFEADLSAINPQCNLCALLRTTSVKSSVYGASSFATLCSFSAIDLHSMEHCFVDRVPFSEFWLHSSPSVSRPGFHRVAGRRFAPSVSGPSRVRRLVDPVEADLATLRRKFVRCLDKHGHVCGAVERVPVPGLKVIDCHTRKIVPATVATRYVALSYVWGGSPSPVAPSYSALPIPQEKTFEATMALTRALGYTHLWIDRFCIDQGSPTKHAQIARMDTIFLNADLTVVAAAGDSPAHGLPGRGGVARATQPCCRVGNLLFSGAMDNDQALLLRSRWSTRAWTYQETRFSRRRLVFTEQYAWFCCGVTPAALGSEAVVDDEDDDTDRNISSSSSGAGGDEDGDKGVKTCRYFPRKDSCNLSYGDVGVVRPWTIAQLVREYSRRDLTFQSDAINAFAGILRAFANMRPHPVYHLWATPIMPPVGAADGAGGQAGGVDEGGASTALRALQRSSSDGFVLGLCWRQDEEVAPRKAFKRREGFPSWSWVGWEGGVCFTGYTERCSRVNVLESLFEWGSSTDIEVSVELNDGRTMPWSRLEELEFMMDGQADVSPFIWLDAWTVDVRLEYFPPARLQKRTSKSLKQGWSEHTVFAALEGKEGDERFAKVELLDEELKWPSNGFAGSDFSIRSRKFMGIILGSPEAQGSQYPYVLLVEEKDEFAQRVGNFFLGHEEVMGAVVNDEAAAWDVQPLQFYRRKIRLC